MRLGILFLQPASWVACTPNRRGGKIDLAASVSTQVSRSCLATAHGEPHHLELDLNRTELKRLVRPVIKQQ
jgi:hypothetical protein